MLKRLIAFFTALYTFIFSSGGGFSAEGQERYLSAIENQTQYVLSLSQADGSVPMTVPDAVDSSLLAYELPDVDGVSAQEYSRWYSAKICPYFSCIAVTGLIEASPESARDAAEKYIRWHFEHLNTAKTDLNGVDGTIYDYRIFVNPQNTEMSVCVPLCELYSDPSLAYDSTDSYAAVFLKLLYTYSKAYPDSELPDGFRGETDRIIGSIYETLSPVTGLTFAKPGYEVCYLMDNCEVYEGLVCAGALYNESLGDSERAEALSKTAARLRRGIQTVMYNAVALAYYPSVSVSGLPSSAVTASALQVFYPAGVAQLFPILCGVVKCDGFRARCLYTQFNAVFGTDESSACWQRLDVGTDFPWAAVVRAAVMMDDSERTEIYFDSLRQKYFDSGCRYPYYCAEAGHVLSAAAAVTEKALSEGD